MIWQIVDGCIDESGYLFFFLFHTQSIYICIIRWDEKVGDKKKRKKGASRDGWNMIREWKTWGTGNVKILFFHSFQERRWRDKVVTVFSEKIHPPLPMAVDAVFFSPAFLFFSSPFSRYSEGGLVAKFRNENIDQKWNRVNFSISCFFFFFFFSFDRNRIQIEGKNYPKNFFEFHYSNDRRRNRRIKYRSIN